MDLSVWCLSEGHAGMETQVVGLARALGLAPVVKRVHVRLPWDWLPGRLWPAPLCALKAGGDRLAPPWPGLIISTGNVAAPLALAVARASGGRTRIVHLQNPKMDLRRFDLVVAPRHDGLKGANVIETRAGLNRITQEGLRAAAQRLAPSVAGLASPRVLVLLGGASRRFRLDAAVAAQLGAHVSRLVSPLGGSVLATASRRTAPAAWAAFQAAVTVPLRAWDGSGDNPYQGWLGLADHIVVTADSVSMISEALASGRPVHVARLPGRSRRLGRFVAGLVEDGYVRWLEEDLPAWSYPPLDEMGRVAALVRGRLGF